MQLTIDKLIYGGNGLARLPADERGPGKAAFLPFVLEGERVEAEITEQKPGFARARAKQILESSPHRVDPACRYFGQCGGCHYQHTSYEHQLEIKSQILRETLRRIAKVEFPNPIQIHPSPPWNYRNRTRLRVRTRPFVLGYNRIRESELLAVEQCPISSPLINRAIAALWTMGRAEKLNLDVQEIELFSNANDTALLAELTVRETGWRQGRKSDLPQFVTALRATLPEITGAALFRASGAPGELERENIPAELKPAFGAEYLLYSAAAADFRVSAGSFFQTNRFLTDALVKLVCSGQSGEYALDLYAGTGLFSVALARNFRGVGAVESSPFSFRDLKCNSTENVRCLNEPVEVFLTRVKRPPDLIVVDPPRAGVGEKVAQLLGASGAPRITYVSCDPATLARDLTVLVGTGYRIEEAHLVDLFPQTFHIESVLQLVR